LYADAYNDVKLFKGEGDGTFKYPVVVGGYPYYSMNGDPSPTIGKNLGFTVEIEMPNINITEGEHTIDIYLKDTGDVVRHTSQKFKVYKTRTTFSEIGQTSENWQTGNYNETALHYKGYIELADNFTQGINDFAYGIKENTTNATSGIILDLENTTYYPSGIFTSSVIDLGVSNPNITYISWNENLPFYGEKYTEAQLNKTDDTLFLAHFNTSFDADYANGSAIANTSGVELVEGRFGQAVHINDTDYLIFNSSGNIDLEKGTIEFWVKPNWNGYDEGVNYLYSIPVIGLSTDWWDNAWAYRVNVTVNTGYAPRGNNTVVKNIVDFGALLASSGVTGTLDSNSIRVTDANKTELDSEVLRWLNSTTAMVG